MLRQTPFIFSYFRGPAECDQSEILNQYYLKTFLLKVDVLVKCRYPFRLGFASVAKVLTNTTVGTASPRRLFH